MISQLKTLIADMENVYGTGKICPYQKENSKSSPSDDPECNLELEPELTVLLAESKDYDELTHVWTAWRNSTGKPIRAQFVRYVELMNEKARRNGNSIFSFSKSIHFINAFIMNDIRLITI